MGIGRKAGPDDQVAGFREELASRAQDRDAFFSFFDGASNEAVSLVRGAWDFSIHIANPASGCLSKPEHKTALEIGYGGGRLLAAASRHFAHVIGVDIHKNSELVRASLSSRGISNVVLYESEGERIPIVDQSVDFIYSFIVFQHMGTLEVIERNLREAFRCLRSGGTAVLYFGRLSRRSYNTSSRLLAWIDNALERLPFMPRWKSRDARINETNIVLSSRCISRMLNDIGFVVVRRSLSRRQVPDGGNAFGGQSCFVVRKPD